MKKTFLSSVHERRSIYTITNTSPIPKNKIVALIEMLIEDVPSAFNCQSARLVVLFGQANQNFWDIVMKTLRERVPADKFGPTETKINCFAAGYGTILYFDDESVTEAFANDFPSYAANFKTWADQANGMLQFAIWTALEEEGLGANLQHYNPIIDDEVKEVFNIPDHYRLIAQMPFGARTAEPDEKEVISGSERMRVLE
ncbi:nitroreductase family protein [Phascolarctobacterium sp.]|uniref:nitroreductase family protein n=1 Tax=Phascolarctobacterium sp. TaxID=2049039 RepID=UPI0015AF4C1A|nr:nitroreductase family protein [uncultured Phascolarctobacterium sp.]